MALTAGRGVSLVDGREGIFVFFGICEIIHIVGIAGWKFCHMFF